MLVKRVFKIFLTVLGLMTLLFILDFGYFYYQEKPETNRIYDQLPAGQQRERLLVFAPHCDDETLGAAGIIRDTVEAGGEVAVVLVTNGDGFTFATREQFRRWFLTSADFVAAGKTRQMESQNALATLGVPGDHIFYLGYPDRGISDMWEQHWERTEPFHSRYTDSSVSPYANSYEPHAPYAGRALFENIEHIIDQFRPTTILLPDAHDEHGDHAATWAFVMAVLEKQRREQPGINPHVYTYLVHRGDYPIPHGYLPRERILPPGPLLHVPMGVWYQYSLSDDDEHVKFTALQQYVSQRDVPIMHALLRSFVRTNELFYKPEIPEIRRLEPAGHESATTVLLLVNPPGVNPLGAVERKGRVTEIYGTFQQDSLQILVRIPQYRQYTRFYTLKLFGFYTRNGEVLRVQKEFEFSGANDTEAEGIMQEDYGVRALWPLPEGLPDYFFFSVLTRSNIKTVIDRTVWQPVRIGQD